MPLTRSNDRCRPNKGSARLFNRRVQFRRTGHIIGSEEHFYGYITGLGVESGVVRPDGSVPTRLYATFEYNNAITIWIVPDHEIFTILAEHLCSMALHRQSDCPGLSKLWIAKRGGSWWVNAALVNPTLICPVLSAGRGCPTGIWRWS